MYPISQFPYEKFPETYIKKRDLIKIIRLFIYDLYFCVFAALKFNLPLLHPPTPLILRPLIMLASSEFSNRFGAFLTLFFLFFYDYFAIWFFIFMTSNFCEFCDFYDFLQFYAISVIFLRF